MNYSYISTPSPFVTSTAATAIRFTRGAAGVEGAGQTDRVSSADPRDIIQFYGDNQGATDITVQVYGLMNTTDDPITKGVAVGSGVAFVAGTRGGITLQGATGGFAFYAFVATAASATPSIRAIVHVKSGT